MKRILIVTIILLVLSACTANQTRAPEPTSTDIPQAGMPNPASVNCVENGNKLEILTTADGSQSGVCVFPDGSTCEEWAYYREECGPAGQIKPTPTELVATALPSPTPAALLTFVDSEQDLGQGNGASVV
ncbi:MAG: DUF333 domain-containing protein, partial [Anaerolineaceae bacterium]|nr:DUF333 domain-containing protein [Anaerolineaceae bacterium]